MTACRGVARHGSCRYEGCKVFWPGYLLQFVSFSCHTLGKGFLQGTEYCNCTVGFVWLCHFYFANTANFSLDLVLFHPQFTSIFFFFFFFFFIILNDDVLVLVWIYSAFMMFRQNVFCTDITLMVDWA